MAEPLLEARDCSFRYGDGGFRLQDVSLAVTPGEVVGIVGPNGSGKSTLLRLMAGFLRPARGSVFLQGRTLPSVGRRRLAQALAFLPQSLETSFPFAVREIVAMGRYPHVGVFGFLSARDVGVVQGALEETEALPLADRSFVTLSGGEKQRVLIASILAQEPSAMLLDEPTASLDIHHSAEVLDLLWRLSRKGIGVVAVTHDLNVASQFCDRLLLLSGGRSVRSGPPADVLDAALLSSVYQADVHVVPNPVTATPMVIVPGRTAHEAR